MFDTEGRISFIDMEELNENRTFTPRKAGQYIVTQDGEVRIENNAFFGTNKKSNKPSLRVVKLDENGRPLPGAKFELLTNSYLKPTEAFSYSYEAQTAKANVSDYVNRHVEVMHPVWGKGAFDKHIYTMSMKEFIANRTQSIQGEADLAPEKKQEKIDMLRFMPELLIDDTGIIYPNRKAAYNSQVIAYHVNFNNNNPNSLRYSILLMTVPKGMELLWVEQKQANKPAKNYFYDPGANDTEYGWHKNDAGQRHFWTDEEHKNAIIDKEVHPSWYEGNVPEKIEHVKKGTQGVLELFDLYGDDIKNQSLTLYLLFNKDYQENLAATVLANEDHNYSLWGYYYSNGSGVDFNLPAKEALTQSLHRWTTSEKPESILMENAGSYREFVIREVEAPKGYAGDKDAKKLEDMTVRFLMDDEGNVTLRQLGSDQYKEDGSLDEEATAAKGKALENLIRYDAATHTFTFMNKKSAKPIKVTLSKQNPEGKVLEGARFQL